MVAPLVTHSLEALQKKPPSEHVVKKKKAKQKASTKAMIKVCRLPRTFELLQTAVTL